MKWNNIYKIGVMAILMVGSLSSCNDFLTIYPTDRIVGTDFWKTKSDVEQMVNGAYLSMISYDVQERAVRMNWLSCLTTMISHLRTLQQSTCCPPTNTVPGLRSTR